MSSSERQSVSVVYNVCLFTQRVRHSLSHYVYRLLLVCPVLLVSHSVCPTCLYPFLSTNATHSLFPVYYCSFPSVISSLLSSLSPHIICPSIIYYIPTFSDPPIDSQWWVLGIRRMEAHHHLTTNNNQVWHCISLLPSPPPFSPCHLSLPSSFSHPYISSLHYNSPLYGPLFPLLPSYLWSVNISDTVVIIGRIDKSASDCGENNMLTYRRGLSLHIVVVWSTVPSLAIRIFFISIPISSLVSHSVSLGYSNILVMARTLRTQSKSREVKLGGEALFGLRWQGGGRVEVRVNGGKGEYRQRDCATDKRGVPLKRETVRQTKTPTTADRLK